MERVSEYVPPPIAVVNNDPDYDYFIDQKSFARLCQDLEIPSGQGRKIIIRFGMYFTNKLGEYRPLSSTISIQTTGSNLCMLFILCHELRHAQQWMKTNRSLKENIQIHFGGKMSRLILLTSGVITLISTIKYFDKEPNLLLVEIAWIINYMYYLGSAKLGEILMKQSYSSHPSEIDANLFANALMINYLGGRYPNLLTYKPKTSSTND